MKQHRPQFLEGEREDKQTKNWNFGKNGIINLKIS